MKYFILILSLFGIFITSTTLYNRYFENNSEKTNEYDVIRGWIAFFVFILLFTFSINMIINGE